MISWISGEIVESWQTNQKFFVLLNCHGIGYEIQILEPLFIKFNSNQIPNKNITLWIKYIKKEDSDLLFGFESKDQKNFFIEILNIRGVGSQIGMGILNKFSIREVISAINTCNKELISSVPGIGKKMTDRLILELKSKFKNELQIEEARDKKDTLIKNTEIDKLLHDLKLTLESFNYAKNEINSIFPIIIKETEILTKNEKEITFEYLLKLAMNLLDNDSSKLA